MELRREQIDNVCMSIRHDYGLLDPEQQAFMQYTALDWYKAFTANGILGQGEASDSAFWMVYLEGGNNPKYIHHQRFSAIQEAKRLATQKGEPAHVLEQIGTMTPAAVEWEGVPLAIGEIMHDELPFS